MARRLAIEGIPANLQAERRALAEPFRKGRPDMNLNQAGSMLLLLAAIGCGGMTNEANPRIGVSRAAKTPVASPASGGTGGGGGGGGGAPGGGTAQRCSPPE